MKSVNASEAARLLIETKTSRRRIVPIVGAGISADSGFPILTSIVRYLGKLHQYIHRNAYLPPRNEISGQDIVEGYSQVRQINRFKCGKDDPLASIDGEYKARPWSYVRDFGWPDRFQLNQELFVRLRLLKAKYKPKGGSPADEIPARDLVAYAVRAGLDEMLWSFNETGHRNYWKVYTDILAKLDDGDPSAETIRQRFSEKSENKNAAFEVVGNWQRLIQHFTNFQGDYSDALFARFGAGRSPNRGHRFLAFLARALHVRTIFTFNFDSLIEEALFTEGMDPLIFSMEHGDNLPHSSLLRNRLSVVKMHGSTHALLLDEQLDHPLSKDYLDRFDAITGEAPLLLVIGCSSGDYRLRHLIRHSVHHKRGTVHWMHYEEDPPEFLEELNPTKLTVQRINSVGMALMHIHGLVTSVHPSSHKMYLAHIDQPICQGEIEKEEKIITADTGGEVPSEQQFVLFSSLGNLDQISIQTGQELRDAIAQNEAHAWLKREVAATTLPKYSASERLLVQANLRARWGYQLIWIDLENCYQFAGVVESIVDQCRRYDVELPSSVLSVDEELATPAAAATRSDKITQTRKQAVEKVTRALRRTRYFLAIDGLESYVWPISAHHGSTCRGTQTPDERLSELVQFLADLVAAADPAVGGLGESYIAVSVDAPKFRYRHTDRPSESDFLEVQVKWLQDKIKTPKAEMTVSDIDLSEVFGERPVADFTQPEPNAAVRLVSLQHDRLEAPYDSGEPRMRLEQTLFVLSCFRRIRPLTLLRRTLKPFWKTTEAIDDALAMLSKADKKPALLRQLEDGGYWFYRSARDYVYEQCTWFTGREALKQCLQSTAADRRWWDASAFQLLFASLTHQQIAQAWYSEAFVQSQDTYAFLEFTYHRLSSIRSLTKLLALIRVARRHLDDGKQEPAAALLEAVKECVDFLPNAGGAGQVDPPGAAFEFDFSGVDALRELLKDAALAAKQGGILISLEEFLGKHHLHELQRLCNAWMRSEMALRAQVPAQQLLLWCKQLIEDDLPYRCNKVVIGYVDSVGLDSRCKPRCHEFGNEGERVNTSEAIQNEISRFIEYLQNLQTKLWVERSAYEVVIGARESQHEESEKRKKEVAAKNDPGNQSRWFQLSALACNQLLDIANSRLKNAQESTATAKDLTVKLEEVGRDLESCRWEIEKTEAELAKPGAARDAVAGDMHEARLRWLHIHTQYTLAQVSVFSHDGFLGSKAEVAGWKDRVKEAFKLVGQGLGQIRSQDPRSLQSPHGVVIDPTADGTFYLQYRALFYLLRGRARWMLNGDPLLASPSDECDDAMRDFEIAQGGLGEQNVLVAALVDMYAAEACLGRARIMLYKEPTETMSDEGVTRVLEQAAAQYESARAFLQHARRLLLTGRRNVIWWKLFFRLITQYHADRLLLEYTKALALKNYVTQETADSFLVRLRKAYQSLRTACDHYPPRAVDVPLRWLRRLWLEISLCSYCAGQFMLRLDDPITGLPRIDDDGKRLRYVVDQLDWLNQSAALHPLPAGFHAAGTGEHDCTEQLPLLLEKFASGDPAKIEQFFKPCEDGELFRALDRRWDLLTAADLRVKGKPPLG